MVNIKDGVVHDKHVVADIYKNIEHGNISGINAIVLHRTDSYTAKATLQAYKSGQKTGAHFLIDKAGHIFQTAKLDKMCWHVGIMKPRCSIEKDCDPAELKTINSLLYEKGLSFSRRVKNLSHHELHKKYPLRYPSNKDSIGIEVVGRFLPVEKHYEKPTLHQLKSLKWLVGVLIDKYHLNVKKDVYAHGKIARKELTEGAQLLQYIFNAGVQ